LIISLSSPDVAPDTVSTEIEGRAQKEVDYAAYPGFFNSVH